MDLGNLFEVVVHHLLIGGMTSLSRWDEIPMVGVLVRIVMYGTKPMVSHDIRLLGSHDFTKLLYYIVSQL